MLHKDIEERLKKTNVLKSYTYNGFKVTVRQERLDKQDRKIADRQIRKQFLKYA